MADVVWKQVFSSNVSELGYQSEPPALLVRWAKGRTSEYAGVDEKLFEELTKAPSVGSALNERVKGKFPHRYVA